METTDLRTLHQYEKLTSLVRIVIRLEYLLLRDFQVERITVNPTTTTSVLAMTKLQLPLDCAEIYSSLPIPHLYTSYFGQIIK